MEALAHMEITPESTIEAAAEGIPLRRHGNLF
jgi:hypothetical protein